MPGLLSNIFESSGGGGREGSAETASDTMLDANVTLRVDVEIHAEGSYRDAEGNETLWSRDVGLSTGTTEIGTSGLGSVLAEQEDGF